MSAYYKQKTKEELQTIINESTTFAEVMKKLGYTANRGNSYMALRKYLSALDIDITKFKKPCNSHPSYTIEEILVKDTPYTNMSSLKKRLLENKLLEYKCSCCGIKEWQNSPLVLQLDHINGDNRDNRIENLRLLCPNCHSQTKTFCRSTKERIIPKKFCSICNKEIYHYSKYNLCHSCYIQEKKKNSKCPEKDILEKDLIIFKTLKGMATKYNVTSGTIKEWLKENNLDELYYKLRKNTQAAEEDGLLNR